MPYSLKILKIKNSFLRWLPGRNALIIYGMEEQRTRPVALNIFQKNKAFFIKRT